MLNPQCDATLNYDTFEECGAVPTTMYRQVRSADGTQTFPNSAWSYRCGDHEKWLTKQPGILEIKPYIPTKEQQR